MTQLLHQNLKRSSDFDGRAIAFRCGNQSLTYHELDDQSSRLATLLIESGVRPGDRVAIRMPPRIESPIAVYAALKAGAVMVPIDPAAPATRVAEVVSVGAIRHLITFELDSRVARSLHKTPLQTVIGCRADDENRTHVDWAAVKSQRPATPIEMSPDAPAYIIFTSGSTGVPKGIVHTHRSGQAYARLSVQTYGVQPGDRIANVSPLHFDMSTFGYFSSVKAGATTVLVQPAHCALPASLSALIESEGITIWYSVPFALVQLLQRGVLESRDLRQMRWILFGGEPLSPKHADELRRRMPNATLSNVYGPAETNQCTFHHIPSLDEGGPERLPESPIPIGKVWEETSVLIVDEQDREVPAGQAGELMVRSSSMMQRYWHSNDNDLEVFFFDSADQRFYRSGDLVRRTQDGLLEFIGRADRQVKVRGYRIELDEIEHAASLHSCVFESAAVCIGNAESKHLVLVVTTTHDTDGIEDSIRRHLNANLPAYAVPKDIHVREAFPRTTSGKIDRRILTSLIESPTP